LCRESTDNQYDIPTDCKKSKVRLDKVVPVLFLIDHHDVEAYRGSEGIVPRILDFGTRWRLVVSFTPGHFTHREGAAGNHWAPEPD
jgi:hypothetical protein